MNTLKDQLAAIAVNLSTAQTFADQFGEKLPKEVATLASVNCVDIPACYINPGYGADDRNRVLSLIGDVFGRDGWTRHKDYGNETFSWNKTVQGVRIHIPRVENIEIPLNESPVPKTAFPLQLAENVS